MNTNKQLYKAPAAKILVVGFEDDLLLKSGQNEVFENDGMYSGGWDDED